MAGLQSVLSHLELLARVTEVVDSPEAERSAYLRLARDGRVDGMVIVDLRDDDPRFDAGQEAGLAFASLGPAPQPTTMPVLVYDETAGHRRRGVAPGGLGHHAGRPGRRAAGGARAAAATGALPEAVPGARHRRRAVGRERLHGAGRPDGDRRSCSTRKPGPTAIVYSNDLMAVAGMGAAFARRAAHPRRHLDRGLGRHHVSQYLHPALSTVTQHPFEDGRMAATLLLEAIEGREFARAACPRPIPVFRPRASTGPAPRRPRR